MSQQGLKQLVATQISEGKKDYLNDLRAMSHEQLLHKPSGVARSAYDFTYEVIIVNARFAKRISGEDPGKWPYESFVTCPEDKQDKVWLIAEFEKSVDVVLEAWSAVPEDKLSETVTTAAGDTFSRTDFAMMCGTHIFYHDGQLNYIQSALGDADVHWS